MKHLLTLLVALTVASTSASVYAASPLLSATIHGTVSSQVLLGPGDGRTSTEKLNNERMFTEFGLSAQAYRLAFDPDNSRLLFRQRNASGNLPDVIVFEFSIDGQTINTKTKVALIGGTLSSPSTGTIFQGLKGTMQENIKFTGEVGGGAVITNVSTKALATGTAPSDSGQALLRFSVKTTGNFEQ